MSGDSLPARAAAFASALDREDYPAARALMAADCRYQLRGEIITGADRIIASYRDHGEEARRRFEQVVYESSVEPTGERSAVVHFIDRLTRGGDTHVHRCRQHLAFDPAGLIGEITHEDLPGEAEHLAEFQKRHP